MKIQFIKDTSMGVIPDGATKENAILIYRDGYSLPKTEIPCIEFEKYRGSYINYNPDYIIIVGLNRIINPQSRCDIVFEYLQTMTSHINKTSIDNAPFIGEPWRFWFHYSIVFGEFLGINYSYAIETDWQHWFYRDTEDCLIKDLKPHIKDTYSDLEELRSGFQFYQPDMFLAEKYNAIKEHCFEKYSSPKLIINAMLRELNKELEIDFNFDSYRINKEWILPNFGIYQFVAEENKRRILIYNDLINGR